MTNIKSIRLYTTETINDVIQGMPEDMAKPFLASLLEMACILVQTGDVIIDITGDKKFKVTAKAKSVVRNLSVDLIPYTKK